MQQIQKLVNCMVEKIKINKKKRHQLCVQIDEVHIGNQIANTQKDCIANTNFISENITTLSKNCGALSDVISNVPEDVTQITES